MRKSMLENHLRIRLSESRREAIKEGRKSGYSANAMMFAGSTTQARLPMQTYYISKEGLKKYQRDHRPLPGDGMQEFAPYIGVSMLNSNICDILTSRYAEILKYSSDANENHLKLRHLYRSLGALLPLISGNIDSKLKS